ncbi:MAG: radical SAM protein, partial [Lachnospiraceae bacterium]|nr:radical SAM protein [Lachnospiraceae bacterium]
MYIKRYPYSGTFELTGRCNLNCSMCYVHVNQKKIAELGERELTTEEWKRIADEVCDAGTFQLLITGGEPLIRSDFAEIYTYIAQKGFFLTLYTNAVLLTDEIFEVLKKYPPHAIGVTIYGVTPETYEAVCGNGDAYYRMRKGLEKILTLPSRVELRTTITRQNVYEAEKLEAFIKGFGKRVTFNINHTIFRSGRNSIARPEEVRISPSENVSFYVNRFENLAKEVLDDPDKLSPLREDLEKAKA